jgi:ABC-type Zn uptake system ZnuABC Zn-binding protein ZnuA
MSERRFHMPGRKSSIGVLLLAGFCTAAWAAGDAPLKIAVAGPDIEAIVKQVGGEQVESFTLFTGCIMRKDLQVEPSVLHRLLGADAVVWTGFLPEAAAVRAAVASSHDAEARDSWCSRWINVSKNARQVDPPVSSCQGYVDLMTTHGDPFFWLNPENGAVIAANVADGLTALRPSQKAYFTANAKAFGAALQKDIARWKEQLRPLSHLRVFSTQCGWQNLGRIGGPKFVVCKKVPGCVLPPKALVEHAKAEHVTVVLLDVHTPEACAKAFREAPGWTVVDLPSSIEGIPGARTYASLFDNMIQVLQKAAKQEGG